MCFEIIDMNSWPRKQYFEHFMNGRNTITLTCEIDITNFLRWLRKTNHRFYASFIYVVSKVVNEMTELRMDWDLDGNLGFYREISPNYAIFHEEEKLFSCITTDFNQDFETFYKNAIDDMARYKDVIKVYPNHKPRNTFSISCIPWRVYKGFSLNNYDDGRYLLPIILWGKFFSKGERTLLPLTLTINHAVADGYHCAMFFQKIEDICKDFKLD